MEKKRRKTGFTLVELMVVLVVIGALASIIFVAVVASLAKTKNARVETDFYQIRIEAGKMYALFQSFDGLCDSGSPILNLNNEALAALVADIKEYNGGQEPKCYDSVNVYCVSAPLFTGEDFCVDFSGYAGSAPKICDDTYVCHF